MANPKQIGVGGVVYNEAALILALRRKVGTTALVMPDDEAKVYLEDARVEINHRKPLVTLQSFPTVADQQLYSTVEANFPDDWTGSPPFVFWNGGSGDDGGCSSVPLGPYSWSDSDEILSAIYAGAAIDRWQIDRVIGLYNYFLHRFGPRGWLTQGNQIMLIPTPTGVSTIYYMLPRERFATTIDIDIQYREAFFAFAVHGAASYLAAMQGELVQSQGPDGKDVRTAGGLRWEKMADAAINKFERIVAPGPMVARSHPGPRFV